MVGSMTRTWRFLILLIAPLLFLWIMSLRPLRLAIADHYFHQKQFDSAVNWYGKIVRKEKLAIDQDKGNYHVYHKDLSKLESALIPIINDDLSRVAQIFASIEDKAFQSLLTEPELALNNINDLLGSNPEQKLRYADGELNHFSICMAGYRTLAGSNSRNDEIENLERKYIFLKQYVEGLTEEAKGNFFLADLLYEKAGQFYGGVPNIFSKRRDIILPNIADQYFNRSPMHYGKAIALYETLVRTRGSNKSELFLKLAYVNAKLNNFRDSLNYFIKAYDSLNNATLKNVINRIKERGTFNYPYDVRFIQSNFLSQYPFLQGISLFETRSLLNMLGINIHAFSGGMIGNTGVRSPAEIIIRSAGGHVGGYADILINGKNYSKNKRGYNIVVLDSKTTQIEESESFDTHGSKDEVDKMIAFVNHIERGKIVCVAVLDEGARQLTQDGAKIFGEIGGKENLYRKWHWGHGIIGIKGARRGEAIEAISEKPVEVYVTSYKS